MLSPPGSAYVKPSSSIQEACHDMKTDPLG